MSVLLPRPVRILVVPKSSVARTERIDRPHHSYHGLLGELVVICLIKTRDIVSEQVVTLAASLSVLAECENYNENKIPAVHSIGPMPEKPRNQSVGCQFIPSVHRSYEKREEEEGTTEIHNWSNRRECDHC